MIAHLGLKCSLNFTIYTLHNNQDQVCITLGYDLRFSSRAKIVSGF